LDRFGGKSQENDWEGRSADAFKEKPKNEGVYRRILSVNAFLRAIKSPHKAGVLSIYYYCYDAVVRSCGLYNVTQAGLFNFNYCYQHSYIKLFSSAG
jgi:hypothetical protein